MSAGLASKRDFYDEYDAEEEQLLLLNEPAGTAEEPDEYDGYDEGEAVTAGHKAEPSSRQNRYNRYYQSGQYEQVASPYSQTFRINRRSLPAHDYQGQAQPAEAVYALSYEESLPQRAAFPAIFEEILAGARSLFRSKLLMLVAGLFIIWLLASSGMNWLAGLQNDEIDLDIYRFETTGVVPDSPKPSGSPPAVAPGAHSVEGSPTITVARIEQVLKQYNSPAAGTGQTLYDLGVKYNIDPAYALAFFIHESSAGTKGLAVTTKSIGNIRQTPNSGFQEYQGFRKYPTWEAGMEDWYKLIRNLYINGWGLRTVEAIVPKYAPAADRNNPPVYINTVNTLVNGWRNG